MRRQLWKAWLNELGSFGVLRPDPMVGGWAVAKHLKESFPLDLASHFLRTPRVAMAMLEWWLNTSDPFDTGKEMRDIGNLRSLIDTTAGGFANDRVWAVTADVGESFQPLQLLRQGVHIVSATLKRVAYGASDIELDSVGIYPRGGSDVVADTDAIVPFTLEMIVSFYLHVHLALFPTRVASPHLRVVYDLFVSDARLYALTTGGPQTRSLAQFLGQPNSESRDAALIAFVCIFVHTVAVCETMAGLRFLDSTLEDWMYQVGGDFDGRNWVYIPPQPTTDNPRALIITPAGHQGHFWYRINLARAAATNPGVPMWPPRADGTPLARPITCGMQLRQLLGHLRPYYTKIGPFATFYERLWAGMAAAPATWDPLDVYALAVELMPSVFSWVATSEMPSGGILMGDAAAAVQDHTQKRPRDAERADPMDEEGKNQEEGDERPNKRPRTTLLSCHVCKYPATLADAARQQMFCTHVCAAIQRGTLTQIGYIE